MSKIASNDTFSKQQHRLVRATFKKAFISAVHANSYTVDVSYAENPLTVVKNVPIADTVDITKLQAGQRCRVDIFDETNPNDSVMAYTY